MHIHTLMAETTMQGVALLIRSDTAHHTHSHTDGTATTRDLGFSILHKGTLTLRLLDNLIYLLSHSHPKSTSC